MVEFVLGIVVGTAFAPFWMMLWNLIKTTAMYQKVVSWFKPKPPVA